MDLMYSIIVFTICFSCFCLKIFH